MVALFLFISLYRFVARRQRTPTGYTVHVASDTCVCGDSRIVHLHLAKDGGLTIGPETVRFSELAGALTEIYATRAEQILYFSVDDDISFQNVADIIDVTQNLVYPRVQSPHFVPEPPALKHPAVEQRMGLQVRIVTKRAVDAPCAAECLNWVKQPLIIPHGPARNVHGQASGPWNTGVLVNIEPKKGAYEYTIEYAPDLDRFVGISPKKLHLDEGQIEFAIWDEYIFIIDSSGSMKRLQYVRHEGLAPSPPPRTW